MRAGRQYSGGPYHRRHPAPQHQAARRILLSSSDTRRNAKPGAMHMVRNVSRSLKPPKYKLRRRRPISSWRDLASPSTPFARAGRTRVDSLPRRVWPDRGPTCAYCAVMPPSITSSAPVIQDASSDARNSTPLAISSAVPSLPIGVRSSNTWRTAGSLKRLSVIGVSA